MQSHATLLVVDDNVDVRGFLREALEDADYRVVTAADIAQALLWLAHQPIDLILLDVWMHGADARTFLERYRMQSGLPIPILLMATAVTEEIADIAMHSAGILMKPFTLEELYQYVEQLLPDNTRSKEYVR